MRVFFPQSFSKILSRHIMCLSIIFIARHNKFKVRQQALFGTQVYWNYHHHFIMLRYYPLALSASLAKIWKTLLLCTAHQLHVLISKETHSSVVWLLTHLKSTVICVNDYPKPITQALISTLVPSLVDHTHRQNEEASSGKTTQNTNVCSHSNTHSKVKSILLAEREKKKM